MGNIKGDTSSGGHYFNRCTDSTNKTFETYSIWSKASDCECNDGKTLEEKMTGIKGLTSNTKLRTPGYMLDASAIGAYIRSMITGKNKIKFNGTNVSQVKINGSMVWKAGSNVTYIVDSGVSYVEYVEHGKSCLSPTSFTPYKSGYQFMGWREDTTANSTLLSSKVMENSDIILYAVFGKAVSVIYSGNGNTGGNTTTDTKYIYYNNGNSSANPTFTIKANGFTKNGYNFAWWSDANSKQYNPNDSVTLADSMTLYVQWTMAAYTVDINNTDWSFSLVQGSAEENGGNKSTSGLHLWVQNGGSIAYAIERASGNINLNGNTHVRIKYMTSFGTSGSHRGAIYAQYNGATIAQMTDLQASTDTYVYLDLSKANGGTVGLLFDISDADTYGQNDMWIKEIYVYTP